MNRFLVDSMLGSLARKLRMCGFDVIYESNLEDSSIIKKAQDEKRIVLTSDEELFLRAHKNKVGVILIKGKNDEERLLELFKNLGIKEFELEIIRCPICNGELTEVSREEVKDKVFFSVYNLHKRFYLCKSCGKIYWEGSHWEKITKFFDRISHRLRREKFGGK
ncbi:MAG: Mut7-C RNAse domain-containing protein [Nitrososphaerales archaeon]